MCDDTHKTIQWSLFKILLNQANILQSLMEKKREELSWLFCMNGTPNKMEMMREGFFLYGYTS